MKNVNNRFIWNNFKFTFLDMERDKKEGKQGTGIEGSLPE